MAAMPVCSPRALGEHAHLSATRSGGGRALGRCAEDAMVGVREGVAKKGAKTDARTLRSAKEALENDFKQRFFDNLREQLGKRITQVNF